jgi:hypothetical protein
MSGYFRDRFQGVGAIAAARPAPRSAPAPSFGALARRGGRCMAGCIDTGTMCDCDVLVTGFQARTKQTARRSSLGRIDVTGDRDTGAAGGGTTTTKSPLRQIMPATLMALPPPTKTPVRQPTLTTSTGVGPGATLPTPLPGTNPPGYLPPRIPVKAQTAGGGAWNPSSPAYTPTTLQTMAPPENEEAPPGSAITGGLPGGAAKIWLVLGLAGVGYLGYRHLKKKRRRR